MINHLQIEGKNLTDIKLRIKNIGGILACKKLKITTTTHIFILKQFFIYLNNSLNLNMIGKTLSLVSTYCYDLSERNHIISKYIGVQYCILYQYQNIDSNKLHY